MIARLVCLCVSAAPLWGQVEGVVLHAFTQEPLANAEVQVRLVQDRQSREPVGPLQLRAALTDEAGRFRFERLPQGNYNVTVSKAGFVSTARDRMIGRMQIRIGPRIDARSLRYTLTPQGVIAGRITEWDGDPAARVQVRALRRMFVGDGPVLTDVAGSTVTNDRGEYRIPELPAGHFVVTALPREEEQRVELGPAGERMATYATFYPGVLDQSQAQAVEVRTGLEVHGIDLGLRRETVFRVRGAVLGSTGERIRNYSVSAVTDDRASRFFVTGRALMLGDGQFELPRLRPGRWRIVARGTPQGEKEEWTGLAIISVSNADIGNVLVNLQPPPIVAGRIRVEGGSVMRFRTMQLLFTPPSGAVVPADDGLFKVTFPEPGPRKLEAERGIPDGMYLASVRAGGQELRSREFEVSGASAELELVFKTDGPSVRVVVIPPEKGGGADWVRVFFIPQGETSRFGKEVMISAEPGKPGDVKSLSPGEYLVFTAWDPNDWRGEYTAIREEVARDAVRLRLAPGERTGIELKMPEIERDR